MVFRSKFEDLNQMDENKCGFCHTGEENETVCGTLHKDKLDGKVVCAHHKCMQYSACLVQYKTDSFGGFKKQEVVKEIKRGSRLICAICKTDKTKKFKKGATSGCAWAQCRKTYHYLCVSMNAKTVAKRYRVAAGDKVVILYRVFCCQDHENRYRENLSADDIVGKNQSSDEGEDEEKTDKDENSDTDNEPPAKKSKVLYSRKDVNQDESGSGMSSPGMSSEEVLTETKRQYNSLMQQKNSVYESRRQNGDEDSYLTAASGHDSGGDVSEDFNTSNSPNESDPSDSSQNVIRSIDEGFHIIIPSKLEMADLKTICKKASYSEETCLLWPKGYNKKGLQDKHMPYIMWNLANKLSHQDTEGFVKSLSFVSVEQYECMYSINEGNVNMELQLKQLANKVNSKFKVDVARVLQMNEDGFFIFLLSLPKVTLQMHDIWSVVNMYQWTKCTLVPKYKTSQLRPFQEKKIILNWLLPRLHNKSVELSVYPREETLRVDHVPKILHVAREIEFRLETISQNLLSKSLVKVLILRKLNRDVVNFKAYLHKLFEQFLCANVEYECYCVIDVLPSDCIHMLEDFLPKGLVCGLRGQNVRLFTAFNPSDVPVSCLIVHSTDSHLPAGSGDTELGFKDIGTPEGDEDLSCISLYLDVDETPVNI